MEFTDDGDFSQDPWSLQSGSTINAPKSFDSVPVYENFTPADRSIYVGNDNNDVPYVRLRSSNDISYVRYIDDPKYDAARELDDWHGTLAWMVLKDHDCKLCLTSKGKNCVYRLHFQSHCSSLKPLAGYSWSTVSHTSSNRQQTFCRYPCLPQRT